MVDNIVLGGAVKNVINSIKTAQRNVDRTYLRLASGLKVNSAVEQPNNFFTARSLNQTASNYSRLLDGLGQGIRTTEEAFHGIEAIESLLGIAENKALEIQRSLEETSSALPDAILENDPIGYFRLNDADQANAANLGSLGAGGDGVNTNGVTLGDEILFYGAGGLPAKFDGNGQYIAVPNDDSINQGGPFPERTVELIFNADSTSGRQVLWEEGGPVNSMNIYIDDGRIRVNGRTTRAGGYGPLDISAPIEAGQTYHVAFTQDGPNGQFTGYLNGEPFGSEAIGSFIGNHPNENGIGAINNNTYFHDDGPGNAPGRGNGTFAFTGQMSDLAIYNSIITSEEMSERYEATSLPLAEAGRLEMVKLLEQIDTIVNDSNYRGINLLKDENLKVDLNDTRDNTLEVEGQNFSIEALGLDDINFQKPSQVAEAIRKVQDAIDTVRDYGLTLSVDLSVIEIRRNFTEEKINTHESGADDLTLADLNEEGANQLSESTRLNLSTTALSLASQSQASILTIFGEG